MKDKKVIFFQWRFICVLIFFLLTVLALVGRLGYLGVLDHAFLMEQGNARSLRVISIPAYRGMILDRNDHPLAVSTPVNSVWINPKDFPDRVNDVLQLSRLLQITPLEIHSILKHHANSEFAYLKRNITPSLALRVQQLAIPGVYLEREYHRFYPMGQVSAQLLGFTNIDDSGQEGLELAYDKWLSGSPGRQRVVKDRYGHVVATIADLVSARAGHDLKLSLDDRIQFLAYRVLSEAVQEYKAKSGSVVVEDPTNGEILAMVNYPSFNPNGSIPKDRVIIRNRAATDMFEPGSTMKAFSIASALDSGKYTDESLIRVSPGHIKVGQNIVRDAKNYGTINVKQVLQLSSNVGVAKMTLSLPPEHLIGLLRRIGFGDRTSSGFPGESPGQLPYPMRWRPFVLATLAFGYGISVTPLQLAQAYSVIANEGLRCPITFVQHTPSVPCQRVMDEKSTHAMLTMLESVVQPGGTGLRARLFDYRVAGKTGTAYIAAKHGYDQTRHIASFVGIAPVTNPRLVVAVVIKEPQKGYFGGIVSAPAFAKIMSGALHSLNVPSDVPVKK